MHPVSTAICSTASKQNISLLYNDSIMSPGSKTTIADGQYLQLVPTGTALLKSVAPF